MADQKEPMIGKSSRPTPIDYDAPLSGMKVKDLLGILGAHSAEQGKTHYEYYKPEYYKPDFFKEYWKPELYKPDQLKEFKEGIKEKEFVSGPGQTGDPVEHLANRIAEHLKTKK
jgi:hypothetical protein